MPVISLILTMAFTFQVNATVINVTTCPDMVTFCVPDGHTYNQYGNGLEVGDVLEARYNPVTGEFHVTW